MENNEPIVSICCLAYNHEPYIRQCLDGFMMQKTDFPFEVLIHDDASTDGTAAIIREYETKCPDIIKPIYQIENQHKKRTGILQNIVLPRAKGKYIALCEGDDYWIDPYKLQKQVDFLEANEDFSICFHAVKIKKEQENVIVDDYMTGKVSDVTDIYDLARGNYIHTPSVVFRKNEEVFKTFIALGNLFVGDYVLHLLNAQYGKIKKLTEAMAVYRVGVGVWNTKNDCYRVPIWLNMLDKLIISLVDNEKLTHVLKQQYKANFSRLYDIYKSEKETDKAKTLFMTTCINYPELIYDEFKERDYELHSIKNSKIYRLGRFTFGRISRKLGLNFFKI